MLRKLLTTFTFTAITLAASAQTGRSMNDGEHYTVRERNAIAKYSYATGEKVGTIADLGDRLSFTTYEFSADEKKILFTSAHEQVYRHSYKADTWVYDIATDQLTKLTEEKQQVPTLSPDGRKVAFVRDNDLYWIDLYDPARKENRVTADGLFNHIINGIPDWVYEEEFGFSRAFEWSPDSRWIAYMRFDETNVKEYNMNMFRNQLYPDNYAFKYPKAGEENSVVEVWCYNLEAGQPLKIDVGPEKDQYIPRIKWTPKGEVLVYRLNRLQNHFEVLCMSPIGARPQRVVYEERNDRYVERVDDGVLTFVDDERFIVRSEKDGYMHLYLYSLEKGFLNRITDGEWEVTRINGVNGEDLWYTSTEASPLKRDIYTIKLNGKGKKRLTGGDGTYSASTSKGVKYYIQSFSNARTPGISTLHTSDGKLVRTLSDNAAAKQRVENGEVAVKEFFTFKTSEGVELNGYMFKPLDFDPSKKYPVFMTQYSGPGSQSVADSYGGSGWDDLLRAGYIVACVDGRGTGYRGEDFKKCTYLELGKYETIDQIEAAKYLGTLPFVDGSRIGIYGWSYGGFMALNCILKGAGVFRAAISVAPVTNWRYYDTIYTEIYNGLPQDNASGYDDNSPINFANLLEGKLLLAHGTGDDNVHIQNTYEMINALVRAGKDFEMHIYPDQNHGMGSGRSHLQKRMVEFVLENL